MHSAFIYIYIYVCVCVCVCMGRESSVGIATRYGLDGPGIESRWEARFSVPVQTGRPWGAPSLLYNGYRVSFPEVNRTGRGLDHPPPSSAKVKERVELYLYTSGPPWPVVGRTLLLCIFVCVYVLCTRYTQRYR
jgi:hypothetical protein